MDFDITHLLPNIIDARRNGDIERFMHLVLRYLSDFDQAVVYAPEGIANCLKEITETPKRTIERSLRSLQERTVLLKMDEFSLQMNGQFSRKGSKPVQYKGPRIFYEQSEEAFIIQLQAIRAEQWALRGKNKRRVKSEEGKENMDKLIVTLASQLEAKDQQMKEQLAAKDKQIEELHRIIAGRGGKKKVETKEKLALVIPIRK